MPKRNSKKGERAAPGGLTLDATDAATKSAQPVHGAPERANESAQADALAEPGKLSPQMAALSQDAATVNVHVPPSPRDLLLPYQRKWADDESRFKIGLMARQVGKDFSSGEEGIRDCYRCELEGNKTNWLIAAPSERQSLESLEKWKEWAQAYNLAIADIGVEREDARNSESLIKSATITFPGGSRVMAVPGRPDTVRGFSANVLGTEFAFFDDPDKTWRALLPSITNPLRGGPKKIRLISTPNGIGNKFHDLWVKNYQGAQSAALSRDAATEKGKWSCHKVTITDAVAQGLPIDIEELRAALDDPEGWAQEYDPLDFLDVATVLLPYELIIPCENAQASETLPPEFWAATGGASLFLGIDFGRKRDLTISWALELIGGVFMMTREVLELAKTPTPTQVEILRPRIRKAKRVCFDYSGPGIGMGDYLVKEFGEYKPEAHLYGKIELVTFTNAVKLEVFPKLRMSFEQKTLGIPVSRLIREDLHSVHRCVTPSGGVTYKAPHTDDGHADRCTGLALARRAANQAKANWSATLIT